MHYDFNVIHVLLCHSDWSKIVDDIIKNEDGSIFNPLASNDISVLVFNCFCLAVGLVASGRVIQKLIVTCNNRGDGWKPRHVLLMGNIVSCILTLFVHCLIPSVYYVWPDEDLCRVFMALFRMPYLLFLFNLSMAVIDRYVAVTRSVWHRTKLTINQCIIWLSFLNVLLAMATKWTFISQLMPVQCALQYLHGLTLVVAILIHFVICTVFLVAVFVITWRQLPRSAILVVPHSPARQSTALVVEQVEDQITTKIDKKSSSNTISVHTSSAHLRRMELQVTKHFLITIIPLFVIVIPFLLLTLASLVCHYFNLQVDLVATRNFYYISLLPTIHVVIYPLANLFLNCEISCCTFSFSFCRCFFRCHCPQQTLTDWS